MTTYTKDELVGVTEFGKSMGAFLDKVVSNPMNKIALVRRNKPEAVILPIETYESLQELSEYLEYKEIYDIIQERVENRKTPAKFLTTKQLKEQLKKAGKDV